MLVTCCLSCGTQVPGYEARKLLSLLRYSGVRTGYESGTQVSGHLLVWDSGVSTVHESGTEVSGHLLPRD